MYGAVIGDIIGSTFEFREVKKKEIPLFAWGSDYTDDTILTIAVARALLESQRRRPPQGNVQSDA